MVATSGAKGLQVVTVTERAAAVIAAAIAEEGSAAPLALWVEVTGSQGSEFLYDVYLQELATAGPGDEVVEAHDVVVVIPASSRAQLEGATLDAGVEGDLVIENPNAPTVVEDLPTFGPEALTNDLARRVDAVLREQINPAIAAHGGYAELVGVVDDVAYVLMGGGCQGCGLASVTLTQGIAVAIREAVPEIRDIIDVTNHAAGNNPYYQPAKK
jgi:Fe/S biogenesis protein NfuA